MAVSNYLKLVARKFYRDKLYTLINLAGLSLAVACCLILGIYLHSEFTYDQHNVDHERIYRIVNEFTTEGGVDPFATTSPILAPLLADEFDEIEAYTRLMHMAPMMMRHEDRTRIWNTVYVADSSVFDLFTHEIIYGDLDGVLANANSIAISESFARFYFGNANPVGEILNTEAAVMTIGVVFADLPENSHHRYDVLLSTDNRPNLDFSDYINERRRWLGTTFLHSYILMPENFDVVDFEPMAEAFIERHVLEIYRDRPIRIGYWLEPLADIHLKSDLPFDEPKGNLNYLYALMAVAVFILLVACINYINLATARSIQRAKQVGMRKILGADRRSLIIQFLAESVFLALISMLIGLIFVELLTTLTPINELFGKTIDFSLKEQPQILLWLVIFGSVIGLVTGLYPAIYLSSWAPLSILVSDQSGGSANPKLRKALVLAQFAVSVTVVACTLLMADQMRFISNKALGFEAENRVAIRMNGWDLIQQTSVIRNELLLHPGVLGVTTAGSLPGDSFGSFNTGPIENNDGIPEAIGINHASVDAHFIETLGIEILEGRGFSESILTDTRAHVVNESFVRNMGWDEPIGKRIWDMPVIGVVEDFHFKSLHTQVEPLSLHHFGDVSDFSPRRLLLMQRFMIVNIAGENIRETIDYLEGQFDVLDPRHPFDLVFLDETLDQLYESDQRLMSLISIFAGICIFIACLGLFGLASFTTEQRRKEIGIRKTLGANTAQVILLLSKNILSLVAIGALAGCIIAYLAINSWLETFAYRFEMGLLPYLIATLVALAVAFSTVALQSYRTARADPVDALRYQ